MADRESCFVLNHCGAAHALGDGPLVAFHLVSETGERITLCAEPKMVANCFSVPSITSEAEYEASL